MGERVVALQSLLNKSALKYGKPEINNMKFNCNDRGVDDKNGSETPFYKQYSMCYNKTIPVLEKFCGPDWTFVNWPSASIFNYETTVNDIITKSANPPEIDKVGWFGNLYSPLNDVPEFYTRPRLKEIADRNPDLLDVVDIRPRDWIIDNRIPNYLSLPDLIKYKYLIDIGGNGYSGRLKYLLFSKRPLLIVDRKYVEYYFTSLIPYVHFIPVKEDLSDLLEQIVWMRNNYEKSLEIANNLFDFAMANFTEDKLSERILYVYDNVNM